MIHPSAETSPLGPPIPNPLLSGGARSAVNPVDVKQGFVVPFRASAMPKSVNNLALVDKNVLGF